jgi:hypothetical protein
MKEPSISKIALGAKKVGYWIPQIFFDLIARIIPGSIIFLVLFISVRVPVTVWHDIHSWLKSTPSFSSVVVFIIAMIPIAYTISVVTWGCWYGLCYVFRTIHIMNKKGHPETGVVVQDFPLLYERIKNLDPSVGNRLTKLKAEIHMAGTFIVGFIISLVVSIYVDNIQYSQPIIGALVVAIIGSILARLHYVIRIEELVESWKELNHEAVAKLFRV